MLNVFKQLAKGIQPLLRKRVGEKKYFKYSFFYYVGEHFNDGSTDLWAHSVNRATPYDFYLGKFQDGHMEKNPDIYGYEWSVQKGAERLFQLLKTGKDDYWRNH